MTQLLKSMSNGPPCIATGLKYAQDRANGSVFDSLFLNYSKKERETERLLHF